jgi:hypothetical protein
MVGGLLVPTAMLKAGREADILPSLTVRTMFANVPVAVGVPDSLPVFASSAAQVGLFWLVKLSASPSLSAADGVKLYAAPTVAVVTAAPLIVGA